MKKSLIFASIACAGAFALHADNWTYQDWFTGIGTGATATNDMKATNGTWSFAGVTSGTVSYESGLVFDLEEDESVAFNVTSATAPDTNTKTAVEVKGIFTPVSTNDLPEKAKMNERGAQIGFVVGTTSEPSTNYYAWVGGDNWIVLTSPSAVDPSANGPETETDLLVTFDYTDAVAAKASFAILTPSAGGIATNDLNGGAWVTLTSDAADNRCVAGVSCYGSGKLVAANGDVGLGIAEVEGVKYGSLAGAVTAASSASVKTIDVLRATNEDVELADGITIEDANGLATGTMTVPSGSTVTVETKTEDYAGGTSGPYSIPLKTSGAGNVNVTLTGDIANYKEIASAEPSASGITVTLQTKTSVLEAMRPDAANGSKGLAVTDGLRTFLNNHCNTAYTQAASTTSAIENALKAEGSNGLKVWQDYVLGITPSTELKPVNAPAGDSESGYIKLAIPELASAVGSGDYSVSYTAGGESSDDPSDIKVPLATGTNTVKVVLTPNP